jgi:hypothetical protein
MDSMLVTHHQFKDSMLVTHHQCMNSLVFFLHLFLAVYHLINKSYFLKVAVVDSTISDLLYSSGMYRV